jgi:hypothetical protein
MTGRSAKMMIAYAPGIAGEAKVTYKTAGGYTHAGLIWNWAKETWEIAAVGYSPNSIAKRVKTVARKLHGAANPDTIVVQLHEVTAPVIAKYFGEEHRVTVTAVFSEGHGWQSVSWKAGRSNLRQLGKDGYTAIAVEGRRAGEKRTADFPMSEIVKSLNSRKALVL